MNESLKKHSKDTGSAQVQIVALTEQISYLTGHAEKNKKDHTVSRTILQKVATRKRFLSYLKRTNLEEYKKVLAVVGLKK